MDADLTARIATVADGLHHLVLGDGTRVFVKRRRAAPLGFFAQEAHGLGLLRALDALRVPAALLVGDAALVLEDLGQGTAQRADWQRAGRGLAQLHRATAAEFGLDRPGWCGDSAQANTPMPDGWQFFAECRLLPQARRAFDARRLDAADLRALERLCANLRSRIPEQPASLVHGDLWRANLHACASGELALIDAAAVHYGWAEADLAMLTLFGEPPAALFDAYQAEAGCDAGWRERAPLYNLYHLLNHLNLFGVGYLQGVRSVLRRF
jgi:protein-ribulosamine 3-kinase